MLRYQASYVLTIIPKVILMYEVVTTFVNYFDIAGPAIMAGAVTFFVVAYVLRALVKWVAPAARGA